MFLTVCLNPTLQKTLRFSSIVPNTVNRSAVHALNVSGKGVNVTRVLTQLGKRAVHLTQLGGDLRLLFLSLCESDGLSVEWVESKSQIRFCYTLLTENDNSITELVEESESVAAGTELQLLEKFETLLEESFGRTSSGNTEASCNTQDTIIISGTKAAGFSDNVFPIMVKKAKEKDMRVILDFRGNDLLNCLKYEPDIIKPNLFEFASTFAPELIKDNDISINDVKTKEKIKSTVMDITQKYKCRVILTNGSRKIFAADDNGFFEVDVTPVKAVNSIGCGDAFTAGLASALEDNRPGNQTLNFNAAIREGIRCGVLNAGFEKAGVIK
ncbi:MAG: PfkB family carbohydrate kinase [Treponema sp.]|nr:PfkB family carbohydrate kinase [Treponema sp.]